MLSSHKKKKKKKKKEKEKNKQGTCTPYFDKGENNYEQGLSTSLKIWV